MTPCLSAPIRSPEATGVVVWLVETCSFAARLKFKSGASCLSGASSHLNFSVGGRPGEFATTDRLLNHLRLAGFELDGPSLDAVAALRHRVTKTFGDIEFVGSLQSSDALLAMRLPDGVTIAVQPELDHRAYTFGWAPAPDSVQVPTSMIQTAHVLIRHAWSGAWGGHEELLVHGLAHGFLAHCGNEFSLNANALCDWIQFDQDLSTDLHPAKLQQALANAQAGRR